MDKKNTFIGVTLILMAVGLFVWDSQQQKKHRETHPQKPALTAPAAIPAAAETVPASAGAPAAGGVVPAGVPAEAKIVTLENADLRLDVNTLGGGLRTVALKKSADTLANRKDAAAHPYLFNAESAQAALALGLDAQPGQPPAAWNLVFSVNEKESKAGECLVLEAKTNTGLTIVRTYALPEEALVKAGKADPNGISFKTVFRAEGQAVPALGLRLNIGTLPQSSGDSANQFLGVSTYDGDTFKKIAYSEFTDSSGFLGMGARVAPQYVKETPAGAPWQWVAVTNQFFAGVVTFDDATRARVSDFYVHPVFGATLPGHTKPSVATLTGEIGFNLGALQPAQAVEIGGTYYVGPREYKRLADLGAGQEKTVQFGNLFGFISVDFLCKMFVVGLSALHAMLPSGAWAWGFAIILLTVIIKVLTWPLVMAQQRSAERMRHFQGPMKEIREKYKNDPTKMNKAMMELYREHRINPFAGCFPVLLQIPIFTGLFFTFQSLAQLRFQSFLWIPDLSMPDVIPGLETIGGFPIHILPVFMGVTMLLNMRLTPMPNVEGQQKMIFYAMMVMFPVICYAMPSALMLYYSVQNVLTIFQTLVTRRKMRREIAAEPSAVIDITPKAGKKKKKKA